MSSGGLFTTAIFNPALLSKEDLIRGFVGRQDLLERLLDDIRRVQSGCAPQHHLIIGQRGLGKTTLLRRLAFSIEDDTDLAKIWMPLVFPEEQYNVKSLADFWLNCADALSDALDHQGKIQASDELDRKVENMPKDADDRSGAALNLLMTTADSLGKRLVLLVDNLDIVLDRLNENEQWEFRRVISEEPRLYFVGGSSRALEALYEHGKPFYDYFQIHELKGLGDDEMFALLGRMAGRDGNGEVQKILIDKPARLRALRVLTGGNPRTLMLLYRILSQGPDGDVQRDLEQLLDLYTPLYKARFEELAPQPQQVLDAMAIHWDPITASELAEKLGSLNTSQVSAQLKRLEDFGVIEKTPWFGESKAAYQVAERFFNIWYLMRASRRVRRRLIWLVRFLETWFEQEELAEKAQAYLKQDPGTVGHERYAETALAYSQTVQDRHLRHSLESVGLRAALHDSVRSQFDFSELTGEQQDLKERIETLNQLEKRIKQVSLDGVDSTRLWELLGGSPELSLEEKSKIVDELPTLNHEGLVDLYGRLERTEQKLRRYFPDRSETIQQLYKALRSGDMAGPYDVDGGLAHERRTGETGTPVAALYSRFSLGCNPEDLSKDEIERAGNALRELSLADGYQAQAAWLSGMLYVRHQDYERAEKAYRRSIELDPKLAISWMGLGNLFQDHLARYDKAEDAFRNAIEANPEWGGPWNNLGTLLREKLARYDEAEQAFRKSIRLSPQDSFPWGNLGLLLQYNLHRPDEAEQAYREAIKLEPQNPLIWRNLGYLLADSLHRYKDSEKAFHAAIQIDPQDPTLWDGLGYVLQAGGRYREAERAFRRAIQINPDFGDGWNDLGVLLHESLDQEQDAEAAYRKAIEIDPKSPYPWGNLARLLDGREGQAVEALHSIFRAAELAPDDTWRRERAVEMARASETAELWDVCIPLLTEVRHRYPYDREAAFALAELWIRKGNWSEAKALLEGLCADSAEYEEPDIATFAAAAKAGYVQETLNILKESGADERWRPVYEALRAYQAGSAKYLNRVAPEVRVVAEPILQEIAPELFK